MTNLEKWRSYMSDCVSPASYIDMGFYYMITAALQRRVWVFPEHSPLFPNMYLILVGGPAVGKGRVINQVAKFMRHHKQPLTADEVKHNAEAKALGKTDLIEPTPLFPLGPDTTTFPALLRRMSNAMQGIKVEKNHPLAPNGIYTHKSIAFILEELSSIFQNQTEGMADFLIKVFDCEDYLYETKNMGCDKLRSACLSLFAGTTPTSLNKYFSRDIIGDGFSSRTVFVCEFTSRFRKFGVTDLSEDQLGYKEEILAHLKKLSKVFGRVQFTPEAYKHLKYYFEEWAPFHRVNPSVKLESYYGRKNIHTLKLAMAVHFADFTDLVMTLDDVKKAIEILDSLEQNMHYALSFGDNPLRDVSNQIIRHIRTAGPRTAQELWIEFGAEVNESQLSECMRYCLATGLIVSPKEDVFEFTAQAPAGQDLL